MRRAVFEMVADPEKGMGHEKMLQIFEIRVELFVTAL